jgi:hypothetical protein
LIEQLAERVGFAAALILKAVGISLEKFSWLDGKSKVENGSRFGSRERCRPVREVVF